MPSSRRRSGRNASADTGRYSWFSEGGSAGEYSVRALQRRRVERRALESALAPRSGGGVGGMEAGGVTFPPVRPQRSS